MAELKPCPFCGGEPTIDRHYIGQRKADYRIICKHCGASFFWFDRLFKAIEAWNRRAENDNRRGNFSRFGSGRERRTTQ